MPDGAKFVAPSEEPPGALTVIFVAKQSETELATFYRQELADQGYEVPAANPDLEGADFIEPIEFTKGSVTRRPGNARRFPRRRTDRRRPRRCLLRPGVVRPRDGGGV